MLDGIKFIFNLLRNLSPAQAARVMAYWVAPGAILLFMTSGVFGGFFTSDTEVPVTASELRTEILPNGAAAARSGIALLVEPAQADFRILVDPPLTRVWSSLNSTEARENKDRLFTDGKSVAIRTPFFGVGEPVAIVVEGSAARSVQIPGGTVMLDDLLAQSKRSITIVASVLLVCMFALGMSSTSGMPPRDSE